MFLNDSKREGSENPEEPKGGDAAIYPSQPALYSSTAILYTLLHYFLPYDIVRPNKLDYIQPCLSEDLPGLRQSSAWSVLGN